MLIQTIAILDLGDVLITHSFNASDKLLKIWLDLITDSTNSEEIGTLEFLMKYRIPIIFKYDFD